MTVGEWIDRNVEELVEARLAKESERNLAKGRERGLAEGRAALFLNVLGDLGSVPEELQARLQEIDGETLKRWTKLAARAESMEEFLEQI